MHQLSNNLFFIGDNRTIQVAPTQSTLSGVLVLHRAPVAQLVEHQAAVWEIVSFTWGLKITEEKVLPL